ncbi:MAG: hypothetical protein ACO1RX_01230 [Candidatus Sericytochromatia bacterium]
MPALFTSLDLLTGARPGERLRSWSCFGALLLLLTSYYLVKPLRSSYYLQEFDPIWLRYFFLAIPVISLSVTRLFHFFYQRLPRFRLILWTYGAMIACKLAFFVLLPYGGKPVTLVFYYWATVYFLLAISVLWGCISSVFSSEAGERTFGFIAFGGMGGALLGSWLSDVLARSPLKAWPLPLAALLMGGVLGFLALALRQTPAFDQDAPARGRKLRTGGHFGRDFAALAQHRYVRALAVMVFALAFMNTVVEFRSQKVIDRQLARQSYLVHFAPLNRQLCAAENCDQGLHPEAFALVQGLRLEALAEREGKVQTWLAAHPELPYRAQELMSLYRRYQSDFESQTRAYFSRINFWINFCGVLLLLGAVRFLLRYLGVQLILSALPLLFLAVGVLLFREIELALMGLVLIATGTLNYSLDKTGRELLYTQADHEARFRFKPLIDGPVMRLGDVSVALLSILWLDVLKLSEQRADLLSLGAGLLVTLAWLWAVWQVGRLYQARRAEAAAAEAAIRV